MKKWLFILAVGASSALRGQDMQPCPEFSQIMRDAEQAEKEGDYRNAMLRYNAAERCNPSMSAEIDERILQIFEKIDQLRKRAESAQRAAEREKRTAQDEARKARQAENRAETLREQAELALTRATQEKNRADEETRRAERKSLEAKSAALSAKARQLQWQYPTLAIRLAEAAFMMSQGDEARAAMDDILSDKDVTFYYKEIVNESPVTSLAVSPDGSLLVAGDTGGICRVWDIKGQKLFEVKAHKSRIMKVAFSPDGRYFASAGADSLVHFWSPQGKPIGNLPKQTSYIRDFAISPAGDRIALCNGGEASVGVWNAGGTLLQTLNGHREEVNAVAFSPDGNYLATGSMDNTARVWDRSGQIVKTFESQSGSIFVVAFSSGGQDIFMGSGIPELWRFQEDQRLTFKGTYSNITFAEFSPDGHMVATNNLLEPVVTIWLSNGTKWLDLYGHNKPVEALAFLPDGRTVVTAGADGRIRFWDIYGNLQNIYDGHDSSIMSVAFSPDGSMIATASTDYTAKIWATDGTLLDSLIGHEDALNALAFSPDGQHILTGSADNTAILWGLKGERLKTLEGHSGSVVGVAFSKNGEWMITASEDSTARIWNKEGRVVFTFRGHKSALSDLAALPDGEHFLTADSDGILKIWNAAGKEKLVLRPKSKSIRSAAVSPNGDRIAAVTDDETVVVWDAAGKERFQLKALPNDLFFTVGFSTDGQFILTGSFTGDVSLWDTEGRKVSSLRNHNGIATDFACSPDGNYLLVPGSPFSGDAASLWLLPPAWLRYAIAAMPEEDIIAYGIREFLKDYGR